ncbi:MAG: hypothetical protein R3286_02870 [Gammaproteobacteria bacterium]|nr:hypothetical protein [Gammaproteobacteria bacterium]
MNTRRKSPVPMLLGIIFGIVLLLCTAGAMASDGSLQSAGTPKGAATGKRQHAPIVFRKRIDTASPSIGKPPAVQGGGVPGRGLPAPNHRPGYTLDREAGRIRFGDGATGARLPTGSSGISAGYRHGAGSAQPPKAGAGLAPHEVTHSVQQRGGVPPSVIRPRGGMALTPLDDPRLRDAAPRGGDTDATMQQLERQEALQAQQQTMQMMSNISKSANDTQKAIIDNMK